ncbi:MAG: hypothetical protein GVY27_07145, partial [Deinococcus-Thermus bacterium]|nr:hypothetical protein [Deinococcota bacterium]
MARLPRLFGRVTGGILLLLLVVFSVDGCIDGLSEQQAAGVSRDPMFLEERSAGSTPAGLDRTGLFYRGSVIASDPTIVEDGGRLRMFYTDLDYRKNRTVIATAVSENGRDWSTEWTRDGIGGLVIAGRDGHWDQSVESASVVRAGGTWNLYFSGYRDDGDPYKGFPAALWLATSSDGRDFTRVSDDPIMEPTRGWYDNDAVYSPTVLRDGGRYYMIYVGHAYTDTSRIPVGGVYLLGATSEDGRNWTKLDEPIAGPGRFGGWRRDGIAEPYLLKRGPGDYVLFYTGLGGDDRALGVATASSPLGPFNFGSAPILEKGARGGPDGDLVLAPAVRIEDGRLRLWYL